VTSDYDPVLNVMGIISLDGNIESFVEVYPTVNLTSVSTILIGYDSTFVHYEGKGEDGGYWDIKEIRKPANIIDNAIVRILSEADTFLFNYDANDGKYKNSEFIPNVDTDYNLNIKVNGFDPVIGELRTPSIPNIDSSLNDTLSSRNTYTIAWDEQGSGSHGLLIGKRVDSDVLCGGEFYSIVEFNSKEFTIFPEWCDPEEIAVGDIDNDHEISLISACLCEEYYGWDANMEKCVCKEDFDEALLDFGGCEGAKDLLGCDFEYNGVIINQYCPGTCEMCISTELDPIDDRIWTVLDFTIFENYIDISVDSIGYCGDGNPDYETLRIRLMAMDDNYYQYFAAERFKDFSNFLFETDGTTGQSIGIKGGFGVFGAFASDTLTRVLSP